MLQPCEIQAIRPSAGCTGVTLTWPGGTSISEVARCIELSPALLTVWEYDNRRGRFVAFSPQFPQRSDLTVVSRLDTVIICMDAPAVLARPLIR